MTLQIGEVIKNRYRIIQIIAVGGMGIVYRAVDESLGVEVALKEFFVDEIASDKIQKIAKILSGLHHPNLPRVTDTFILENIGQFLVMDFIPGEDLKSLIERKGPLEPQKAIHIISEVGAALKYLHSQNPAIIHQDVKPGNIRITLDGKVLLIDFDLMTLSLKGQTSPSNGIQGLTPGFAAPEQYSNLAIPQSDQYGLAATLIFAMTGSLIQDGLSRASNESTLPKNIFSRISIDIRTTIEKAISINPADRYTDIQSFLSALSAIKPGHFSSDYASNMRTRGKKNFPFIPILVGTGIIVVIIALLVWGNSSIPSQPEIIQLTPSIPIKEKSRSNEVFEATNTVVIPIEIIVNETEVQVADSPKISPTPLGGGSGEFAYVSEQTGNPQLFLGKIDGSETIQLSDLPEGACQPDWAPDGKKLVFTSPCRSKDRLRSTNEPFQGSGLFVLNLENQNILPIPSVPGGDFDPAWSPDGKQIAFTSLRKRYPHIFIFDLQNEEVSQLTNGNKSYRQPAWSPDGKTIAYCSTQNGPYQVWLTKIDDLKPTPFSILENGAAFTPDWAPDGELIVYSQTNSYRLATKHIGNESLGETILNPRLNFASNPDFSVDGKWLLIDSNMDGNHRVYRLSGTGAGVEPISSTGETAYHPAWRPAQ
jgi:serine/threonine protein kinase